MSRGSRRWPVLDRGRWSAVTVVLLLAFAVHSCTLGAEDRPRTTGQLVAALERYLGSGAGDVRQLTAGVDSAEAELAATRENVIALGITDLRLRHRGPATTSRVHASDRGTVTTDVEVSWRLAGHDDAAATLVIPVEVGQRGDATVFRTLRVAGDHRVPLWLLAPLTVRRTASGLVAAVDPDQVAPVAELVARASAAVRAAVPRWRGSLVVEVPATEEQYAVSTGSSLPDGAGSERVAVTTTADSRRSSASATRIHLHPTLFGRLGPRAQQVVVTHEAAHVALGSPVRRVPAWLAEGVADHVALAGSGIPVADAAAQAISLVRREGLPSALPTEGQMAGATGDAGGWYEAAWLAVRVLVEEHGEAAVLELYDATVGEGSTARTLPAVLGTTEEQVVVAWRRELARLARLAG